ncbi:MAG: hypothetical protein Q8N56_02615 [bacterium]|nr:hypothetical protein [bacterium]
MKKVLTILGIAIIIGVGVYYFIPKTMTYCGSALPQSCQQCTCNRGFPFPSAPIGGSQIKCFLGGAPVCEFK